MLEEFKEIEEIIKQIDDINLEDWNKRENETQAEFEERIQEIEDEIEDELIDAISDSLLNEQKINEEEAVKEAKEKIQKEYEIYQEAFDKDNDGKLLLKNSEELAKLGYESTEEIKKLNIVANNYNNPNLYIESIRNSIEKVKDVDEEIERKLEIAKIYIYAKIRGEEPIISSNAIKTKKYEDNNEYIGTTKQLSRVPVVQNEMIYNNILASRGYVRYMPYLPKITKNSTIQVNNNTMMASEVSSSQRNIVANPMKLQMLRNIEKNMDKSNEITKQKIKSRTELKRAFKEYEGKELNENENNNLKQRIAEIDKKYPHTVNEKILSRLYESFKIKQPEKKEELKTEPIGKLSEEEKQKINEKSNNLNSELEKIDLEEKEEQKRPVLTPMVAYGVSSQESQAIRQKRKVKIPKLSTLAISTTIGMLKLKGKKKIEDLIKPSKNIGTTIKDANQEAGQIIREIKQDISHQVQQIGNSKNGNEIELKEIPTVSTFEKKLDQSVDRKESEDQKNSGLFAQNDVSSTENYPNIDIILKTFELGKVPNFDIESFSLWDFSIATKYLEDNDDQKNQILYQDLVKRIDEFTGKKFISKLNTVDGYFDIMLLEKMHKLYSEGLKKRDGSGYIIEKNANKAKEYLSKEFSYLEYLKAKAENKEKNPIENIKNEVRFSKALNMISYTSISKKIDGIMLMAKSEILKRRDDGITYQTCKDLISKYENKMKNNQPIGLYALETLGNIYYQGILAKNGDVILKPDKVKAKDIYEELIEKYQNSKNEVAYNRLLNLYSDNTLPIYDKEKVDRIKREMKQRKIKERKVSNKVIKKKDIKCAYVCSDLHGEYEAYKTVIDRVGENNKLYILGDVIDRGPDGIKILQDIIERQEKGQVEFFMGNHEYMMLESILGKEESESLWKYNDKETREKYEELSQEEQDKIKNFLQNSLIYKQIREGNQDYYLVHAKAVKGTNKESQSYKEMKLGENKSKIFEAVFDRAEDDCKVEDIAKEGIFTIIGHTPTISNGYQIDINKGYVDIDCGISYGENVALLNLTSGDIEYFNAERIKEKNKNTQKVTEQEVR